MVEICRVIKKQYTSNTLLPYRKFKENFVFMDTDRKKDEVFFLLIVFMKENFLQTAYTHCMS
jgi:hypothetical protein